MSDPSPKDPKETVLPEESRAKEGFADDGICESCDGTGEVEGRICKDCGGKVYR